MRSRLAAIGALLTSCGGGPAEAPRVTAAPDGGRDAGPLAVELGEGRTSFRELPRDGAEMELVLGPQGGWHFDLATRLTGADPATLTLSYGVADEEGRAIHVPFTVVLNARRVIPDGPSFLRVGDRAVLDVPNGGALVGRSLTVTVDAVAAGARARDGRTVRVVDRER